MQDTPMVTSPIIGPRIQGEAQFQREAAELVRTGAGHIGSRILDTPAPAQPVAAVPVVAGEGFKLDTIRDVLRDNPLAVDQVLSAELARPEPDQRRGAFKLLFAAEQRREGGPRPQVILEIDRAYQHLFQASLVELADTAGDD